MFNFIRSLSTSSKIPEFPGLLPDPRTEEEKLKDFSLRELGMASTPLWKEKSDKEWRQYMKFDQFQQSSCVSNATTKSMGIANKREEGRFVDLSRKDLYSRRYNNPGEGMNYYDACTLAVQGVTLEQFNPSYGLTEAQMNNRDGFTPLDEKMRGIFRMKNFIATGFNIDNIALGIDRGGSALIGVRFNFDEWSREVPIITTDAPRYGHGICATDYTLYNGQKALVIEDSTGHSSAINGHQRILTESFLKRLVAAYYFEDISNLSMFNDAHPQTGHQFNVDMGIGETSEEIKKLQEVLSTIQDGAGYIFPATGFFTGYFGGITRNAVKRFQILKNIQPVSGFVGPLTRAALNSL